MPLVLFKSYLENQNQFISVNNINSDILPIEYGVPQGSVLGPLFFLIYINDLNNAIDFSDVHHFADDTHVLFSSKSLKDINKKINFDLKNIFILPRATKILLNADKTELVLLSSKNRNITKNMNFRTSEQKMKLLDKAKYLDLFLDENLSF